MTTLYMALYSICRSVLEFGNLSYPPWKSAGGGSPDRIASSVYAFPSSTSVLTTGDKSFWIPMIPSPDDSTGDIVTKLTRRYLFPRPIISFFKSPRTHHQFSQAARFPAEILSTIFLCYVNTPHIRCGIFKPIICCTPEVHSSPFLLAQVCSSWRTVAFSTRNLWSSLHVTGPTPGQIPMIQAWLELSKNIPMSISFRQQPILVHSETNHTFEAEIENLHEPNGIQPITIHLLSLFIEHAERWKSLQVELMFPLDFSKLDGSLSLVLGNQPCYLVRGFQHLESISFNKDETRALWSRVYQTNTLQCVHLHRMQSLDEHRSLPWRQLTTLRCDNIAEHHFWFIIHTCQLLQSLVVQFDSLPEGTSMWHHHHTMFDQIDTVIIITLRFLHTFSISFKRDPFFSVFECLTLPSLEILTVKRSYDGPIPDDIEDHFCDFMVRSKAPLKELRMPECLISDASITSLGTTTNLSKLSRLYLEWANGSILTLLTLPTRIFFPNLLQLEINSCTIRNTDILVDMLRSRIYQLKEAKIFLEGGSKINTKDIPYELRFQNLNIELYDHNHINLWTGERKSLQCDYCGVSFIPKHRFMGVFDNS